MTVESHRHTAARDKEPAQGGRGGENLGICALVRNLGIILHAVIDVTDIRCSVALSKGFQRGLPVYPYSSQWAAVCGHTENLVLNPAAPQSCQERMTLLLRIVT